MKKTLIKILKRTWNFSPELIKKIVRRKVSTLNNLINGNTPVKQFEISTIAKIDVVNEYRELLRNLVVNLNEMHSRIQALEQIQRDSLKSE